ncbi:YlbF/YmcA family competence regulator [Streptococcus sp. S784/96/1]|uniref:YlbF/YmcA family competence regulator n=1 Tax=Streptococcus sp. S784/96/1 TaxID=2653499 RepID=UPI0013894AA9|nr:YlbF/YmcA family competence regulator [Streptococcus sp. S784/96/1]
MENIYDLANNLERAIRALPEYQAVKTAKEAVDADAAAKGLWEEFLVAQNKIQALIQSGQMPSPEDQAEMTALGDKIEKNSIVKAYFTNQQALGVYVADLERIIFKPLQELAE